MHQDDVQMNMDIKDSTIEATAWLSGDLKTYEVIPFETIEDCQFLAGYLISRKISFKSINGNIEFKAPEVVVDNMKKHVRRLSKIKFYEKNE